MNIWSRYQLYICLNWLHLLLHHVLATVPRTLLMMIQGRKNLRLLTMVMTLWSHWASRWEHYRLTSSILSRWNSGARRRSVIFKDTSNQLLTLISLEMGNLRLIWPSRRDNSLAGVLRAHIIVLEAVPALPTGSLRGIFIALGIHSLILLIVGAHWQSSNMTWRKKVSED